MSKSSLYRKIKTMTGLSPIEFIRNIRLKHACQMLKDKSISISEVAYSVGFSDPKYFTSCFKTEFNITPSEYQKGWEWRVLFTFWSCCLLFGLHIGSRFTLRNQIYTYQNHNSRYGFSTRKVILPQTNGYKWCNKRLQVVVHRNGSCSDSLLCHRNKCVCNECCKQQCIADKNIRQCFGLREQWSIQQIFIKEWKQYDGRIQEHPFHECNRRIFCTQRTGYNQIRSITERAAYYSNISDRTQISGDVSMVACVNQKNGADSA